MHAFLLVLFVPVCFALIAIILLQVGKGAGFAGAFGTGGGNETIFGARAGTFLTKLTAWLAGAFMVLALIMATLSARTTPRKSSAPAPSEVPIDQPAAPDAETVNLPAQPETKTPTETPTAAPTETPAAASQQQSSGQAE